MDRDKSCEERIDREYKYEREKLLVVTGMVEMPDEWYTSDDYDRDDVADMIDRYRERALWMSATEDNNGHGVEIPQGLRGVTIEMSTGGPADGFVLGVEGWGFEVVRAWYYYQDWYDGAVMECDKECVEALREVWESSVEWALTQSDR